MEKVTTLKTIATTWSVSFTTAFALNQELQQAILVLSVLIIIDFCTWLIKSWRLKETSSEVLSRGFVRKMTLIIIPLTLQLVSTGVQMDLTAFITWTISALIFSEGYSIIWNIYTVQTGKKAKEYDVMTILIKKLWRIIDAFLVDKKD